MLDILNSRLRFGYPAGFAFRLLIWGYNLSEGETIKTARRVSQASLWEVKVNVST